MQRTLAVLIIASFAIAAIPTVNAETVTEEYFGTAGVRVLGEGIAVSWRPCPGGCDLNDDGTEDVPDLLRMGGGPLTASTAYSNVIVSVNDDIFGSDGSASACFWHPDGDNICDDDDYGSDHTCGTVPLLGSPFPSDSVTVWVHTVLVTEDLDTCGGFSGTFSGDFF